MLNGFVLGTADVCVVTHWQAWVSIICVLGAYICGAEHKK